MDPPTTRWWNDIRDGADLNHGNSDAKDTGDPREVGSTLAGSSVPVVSATSLPSISTSSPSINTSTVTSSVMSTTTRSGLEFGTSSGVPNAWTGAKTFAEVVKPPSSSPRTHVTSTHMSQSEVHRTQRTFIVRRAPPSMSPQQVIQTVSEQMKIPAAHLFESVLRDPQDRRRMYLTFKSFKLKERVAGLGFKLGNVTIKPSDGTLSGYIPFPPFYIDVTTIVKALSRHGQVTNHSFVSTNDGIRVAGFKFNLKLHQNAAAPREFRYGDALIAVRYDDDLRRCTFCNNFGHTIKFCRKKGTADAERKQTNPESPQNPSDVVNDSINAEKTADADMEDVDPGTCADASGAAGANIDADTLDELKREWWKTQDELIRKEAAAKHDLLVNAYCRTVTISDVAEEFTTEYDPDLNAEIQKQANSIRGALYREYKADMLATHDHHVDYRKSVYQQFLLRGLPTSTPLHPCGYDESLTVPRDVDFTTVKDMSEDDFLGYVAKFGIASELRQQFRSAIAELPDPAMEEDTDSAPTSVQNADPPLDAMHIDEEDPDWSDVAESDAGSLPSSRTTSPERPATPTESSPPANTSTKKKSPRTTAKSPPKFSSKAYHMYRKLLPPNYTTAHCTTFFHVSCSFSLERMQRWLWYRLQKLRVTDGYDYVNPVATIIRPTESKVTPGFFIFTPDDATAHQLLHHMHHTAKLYGVVDLVTGSIQKNPHYMGTASEDVK